MAEVITSSVTRSCKSSLNSLRQYIFTMCAVVTGANKGIGFGICKQLAAKGITVVLTARDEKRGREAAEKLRGEQGLSDLVVFHQLEVTDPASVASLVDFIKTKFGKLDILINNAGINGVTVEGDVLVLQQLIEEHANNVGSDGKEENKIKANGKIIETYELAEECLQINYHGAKRMIEAFIPLLELSDLPRIVNVSSLMGILMFQTNEWVRGVLSDVERLTEERIDEVVNEFLQDFKEGSLQAKNWHRGLSAYKLSKAAMNGYTMIISKNYPNFCINCVCPGYVRTNMCSNTGWLSVEEGAESPVKLALLPDGTPSGLYFLRDQVSCF